MNKIFEYVISFRFNPYAGAETKVGSRVCAFKTIPMVKGRVTTVKNADNTWTSFTYNAMSEQVKATDPMGNSTISKYDKFGRRTSRIHPDAGETIYKYDLAGNLTELITANLSKSGGAIQYKYDHERLTDILYPDNPENDVRYEYGKPGESENRAGRINPTC